MGAECFMPREIANHYYRTIITTALPFVTMVGESEGGEVELEGDV